MGRSSARPDQGNGHLLHLDAPGRPFLPGGQPPITAADYLEMLELGEMLAEWHGWNRRQPILRSWPAHSLSRSSDFWILPVAVLGSLVISTAAGRM